MAKKERDFNAPYRKEAAIPHININPTQERSVHPSVMTVQRGVLDAGVVGDLVYPDVNIVEISELNGADPLRVDFDFVGIETLKTIFMFAHYEGGGTHFICMEIELIVGGWEGCGLINLEDDFLWYHFPVYFPERYVNAGAMKMRLRHIQNGVNSHDLFINCLGVIHTTI